MTELDPDLERDLRSDGAETSSSAPEAMSSPTPVTAEIAPRRPAPPRLIRSASADATSPSPRRTPSSPSRLPRRISRRVAAAGIGAVAIIPVGGVVAAALTGQDPPAARPRPSTSAAEPSAPPAQAAPESMFSDVPLSHPRTEDIEWAADTGLLTGDDRGRFRPDAEITRSVLAIGLHRFAGEPEVDLATPIFTDLEQYPADHVAAMQWAGNLGILWGDEEMRARPDAPLERTDLASSLHAAFAGGMRAAGTEVDLEDGATFADVDEEDPAAPALHWAVAAGCLDGIRPSGSTQEEDESSTGGPEQGAIGATSLSPARTATRAELATALHAVQHLLDD